MFDSNNGFQSYASIVANSNFFSDLIQENSGNIPLLRKKLDENLENLKLSTGTLSCLSLL
jgi:hypothetical protein